MKKLSFLFVIAAGILWGTSGIFVNNLAPLGFSSLQMTALRGGVTLIALIAYAVLFCRSAFRVKFREICMFALTGLALFGTGSCYFLSMQASSISCAVVLMYMAPVYVTVWSVLFFSEKMSKPKVAAILCVLLGCVLVSGIIDGASASPFGIFMGFMSGVSYGAYNILTKISMRRGSSPLSATVYSTAFMLLLALCLSNPEEIVELTAKGGGTAMLWIIGIGVVTFILPYLFYTLALRDLPAGTASAISVVEPMSATLFGIFIYGERLTPFSAIGIGLIIFAVILLGITENKKETLK